MSQAHGEEDGGGKDPMWVVLVEGILREKDDDYTPFHDLAWSVTSGLEDYEYALSECRHVTIARAFVIDQKEKSKRQPDT